MKFFIVKKYTQIFCLSVFVLLAASPVQASGAGESASVKAAPNGIELPAGYKDWRVISQSHRTDNKTVRIILGNDIAIAAARSGNTNPWPKGSTLAKLVWKQKAEEFWPSAIAPDKFVHAEFMLKDSEKYKSTGGWGYARWTGLDQKPYGKDSHFSQECMTCHLPVKGRDWVFTTPAVMP